MALRYNYLTYFNIYKISFLLFFVLSFSTSVAIIKYQLFPKEDRSFSSHGINRYRKLQDGSYDRVPLNLGLGTHFAWVFVGNPPQRSSVIVDTGSHLMAFPCSQCPNCGHHTDPGFDISKSTTVAFVPCSLGISDKCSHPCPINDQCTVTQSYTEGSSWTATLIEDYLWLSRESLSSSSNTSPRGVRFKFGCQFDETGLFRTQVANGIIGVADDEDTLIPTLHRAGKIKRNIFSLCFGRDGGCMVVGGIDRTMHLTKTISYAALLPKRHNGWFSVFIKDIRINGQSINIDPHSYNRGKGVIVDSGTTDTFLPSTIRNAFMKTFKTMSGFTYQVNDYTCRGYTTSEVDKLPSIQLVLKGKGEEDVIVEIPPSQYLETAGSERRCSSIYLTESDGGVLGGNFMRNFDVIFDSTGRRIAFVRANCAFADTVTTINLTTTTSRPQPFLPLDKVTNKPVKIISTNGSFPTQTSLNSSSLVTMMPLKPLSSSEQSKITITDSPPVDSQSNQSKENELDPSKVDQSINTRTFLTTFALFGCLAIVILLLVGWNLRRKRQSEWRRVPVSQDRSNDEEEQEFGLVDVAEDDSRPETYHDKKGAQASELAIFDEYSDDDTLHLQHSKKSTAQSV